MTSTALPLGARRPRRIEWRVVVLAPITCAFAVTAALGAASSSLLIVGAVVAFTAICAWLFATEKYHHGLVALLLYLALADGFLKLRTGEPNLTLIRDVLLYALVAGIVVRHFVAGRRATVPPMTGWVLAFVAVVLIQVFNPLNGTLYHSFAGVRQHLEWVPLFFLAFATMRSRERLRNFLLLLAAVAAINGAVSFVQFHITPDQLATWGPGYASRVNGSGAISSRTFRDDTGVLRSRPPALGSDMGFGGILGLLAAPGALALVTLRRGHRKRAAFAALLAAGIVVAIATSQARVAVVGSALAVLAFISISVLARRSRSTLGSAAAVLGVALLVVLQLGRGADPGAFQRYDRIALSPAALVSTTYDYRRGTFAALPEYLSSFPLGAGLGTVGPAAEAAGAGRNVARVAGETQPSFILLELGIPGLVVFFGFAGMLAVRAITRIPRLPDPETRVLLSAVAAALLALLAAGAVGAITTSTPGSPFFWFSAGILAYWVGRPTPLARHEPSTTPMTGTALPPNRNGAGQERAPHPSGRNGDPLPTATGPARSELPTLPDGMVVLRLLPEKEVEERAIDVPGRAPPPTGGLRRLLARASGRFSRRRGA